MDEIALMATISSILAGTFESFSWTGFYRVVGESLVVGPYQGTVGFLEIEIGRGVCGTAAARGETVIVSDVSALTDHTTRDPSSKSEIAVPVFNGDGDLVAVLAIDSDQLDAFDGTDALGLETICEAFRAY